MVEKLRTRKGQRGNISQVGDVRGLGVRRDITNSANPGSVRSLPDSYREGPPKEAKKLMRELSQLLGTPINEKFFGLLPDPIPPQVEQNRALNAAERLIRDVNTNIGRTVLRRLHTPKGFAIHSQSPNIDKLVRPLLHKYRLEQDSGPNRSEDGFLFWIRDGETHRAIESVEFEDFASLYENVTQTGKYSFEKVGELRDYLVDRAERMGMIGDRIQIEIVLDDFFRKKPPIGETFINIRVGSEEHLLVEAKKR